MIHRRTLSFYLNVWLTGAEGVAHILFMQQLQQPFWMASLQIVGTGFKIMACAWWFVFWATILCSFPLSVVGERCGFLVFSLCWCSTRSSSSKSWMWAKVSLLNIWLGSPRRERCRCLGSSRCCRDLTLCQTTGPIIRCYDDGWCAAWILLELFHKF